MDLLNTILDFAMTAGNLAGNGTDTGAQFLEANMRLFCRLMQYSPFVRNPENYAAEEITVMANVSF